MRPDAAYSQVQARFAASTDGKCEMTEPQNDPGRAGWVGMLVFAIGFAGLGVWGLLTGQIAWGIGSVLFGLVWGFAALRARQKSKSEG